MMAKKRVPEFESVEDEAAFWEEHDTTEFIDPEEWRHLPLPELAPSTMSVTFRLPETMLVALKEAGSRRGVPYQSLLKTILYEWLQREERVLADRAERERA